MEWNGIWNRMEWNGMNEWNGTRMEPESIYNVNVMEWNGMEWNYGMNGMNGMNGMEWNQSRWNGMEWNAME